jgi:hypothetical protein
MIHSTKAAADNADPFGAIARAIAAQVGEDSRKHAAEKRAADAARPIGTKALDFDFWSKADRDKPVEGGHYTRKYRDARGRVHEVEVSWYPAQWCVCLYRWDGARWKKLRRITGPIGGIGAAMDALFYEMEVTGIERMPQ